MISIASGISATLVFAALNAAGVEQVGFLPTDYDYVIYPAAAASVVGLVAGSLLTPRPEPERLAPFLSSRDG